MKILMVPSWYFSDERPTLGSFFREQALSIHDHGIDIRVAYTELRNPSFIFKDLKNRKQTGLDISFDNGMKTYRFVTYNIPPRLTYSMELRFYLGLKRILDYLIESEGWVPDLIHLHSFFPAGSGVLKLHHKLGIPYIITEHSTGFSNKGYKKYQISYLTKLLANSSKIIAVGKGLKDDLQAYTNKNIDIIPNMVDCGRFNKVKKAKHECFTFFSLAYLTHKKGFDILIKAFAQAFKGDNSVKLRIGGDGSEKNKLLKLCRELAVDGQVEFLGALDREQVIDEMNSCHAFVLASRFETFGVVFIEALSCGKPIIVPDIDGPNDIVNDENGYTFERGNANDLESKLLLMQANYSLFIPEKIAETCNQMYDLKPLTRKVVEIYKENIV